MNSKLSERLAVKEAITPQDINGAGVTSAYYSMQGIGRVLAVATTAALAATKGATLQFMQATDDQGTGAKALGDPVTVTTAGGGTVLVTAEAHASDLDISNDFAYVAIKLSSDNGVAVDGAAILLLGDRSFRP